MITRTKARLIAGDHHSGSTSPLYRFYRNGDIDKLGMSLEINDAMRYANGQAKKQLKLLHEYIFVVGNRR